MINKFYTFKIEKIKKLFIIIGVLILGIVLISCDLKTNEKDDEDYYNIAVNLGYTEDYSSFISIVYTTEGDLEITDVEKDSNSHIIVTLSNGETIDLGEYSNNSKNEDEDDYITITNRVSTLTVASTAQLSYTTSLTTVNISWQSSNEEIATVDENGLVTAISAGVATITVYANSSKTIKDTLSIVCKVESTNTDKIDDVNEPDEPVLNGSTINVSNITEGESYTITEAGSYTVTGENSNAQLIVDCADCDVILLLDNVTLTYLGSSSPIMCVSANSLIIKTETNSINTISDSENNLEKAAIQVKSCNLSLKGEGTLIVNGNGLTDNKSGQAIYNSKELTVYSGTYTLTSNDNALNGKDSLVIADGNFTIVSLTDGLKSSDGTITIHEGDFNITATSDGIQGELTVAIAGGDFEIISGGEGIKATNGILINNGNIFITAGEDGIKASGDDTEVNLEIGYITINGGTITINAINDGIQAQIALLINDGTINVTSVEDGIVSALDSIEIYGGTITIDAGGDGIQGETYLMLSEGTYNITSGNGSTGTIQYMNGEAVSSKGIKSTSITINAGIYTINSCEDAIHSNGNVAINGGTFTITSGYDGISADTTLYIQNGDFDITTYKGATSYSSTTISAKGLKSTNELTVDGGIFDLNCYDDAIHSNSNVTINAGTFEIATGDDGCHADALLKINDGTINITKSYEGLEGNSITINGGNIHVVASDDGINGAGGDGSGGSWGTTSSSHYLTINGGYIYVNATGDGLDCNGSIVMTGGTVVVFGPTNGGNGTLDYDTTFSLTGGTFIGCGSTGMLQTPTSSSSTQYVLSVSFTSSQSANKAVSFTIDDEDIVIVPPKTYQNIMISTSNISKGDSIVVKYNGTYSGGTNVDGIVTGATYSGTTLTTLTVSSIITSYGSTGGGTNPGGGGTRPGKW